MAKQHPITLASNGAYWQARYYDALGRRRGKVLGAKAALSRRQAQVLCERMAVELQLQPGKAELGQAPTLAVWIERFMASKPDLGAQAKRAYKLAAEKFKAFAGAATRIDRITPAAAGEFVQTLTLPAKDGKVLSPASIANYARHLRCLFNEAVHQRVLLTNPFARIRTQPKAFARHWHYVPRSVLTTILSHCPNHGWRSFLALQRIGALRKGEALQVTWAMVDWARRVLTLPGCIVKTGKERHVPLDPELHDVLKDAYPGPSAIETLIVPKEDVDRSSDSNQHKRLRTILKRAGVEPWEDLFQTLRRNAVQDLRQTLKDGWVVTSIAGHSEAVQRDYYLGHIRQDDIDRVTGQDSRTVEVQIADALHGLSPQEQARLLAQVMLGITQDTQRPGPASGASTVLDAARRARSSR